jgi:hypothetical protein
LRRWIWWALAGCAGGSEEPVVIPISVGPPPEAAPGPVALARLTTAEYTNAVHDLLGAVLVPTSLEPDVDVEGLFALGASVSTISPLGVEQYEDAALLVSAEAMATPELRDAVVLCTPAGATDPACAEETLSALGRRAYRRPLEQAELDRLVAVAGDAAAVTGDFYQGLGYAIAAVLQSPNFLYRVELGEDDPDRPGSRRYTDFEMASRLSFFLWDTLPDDALLDAAAAGRLTDDQGLADEVARMLADERTRGGVRAFFSEMFTLHGLDALTKDPLIYVAMSDEVGASAREEILLGIEHLVFEEDGDWRSILTTHRTFIDRKLAQLYDVPAPAAEGFAEAWLPLDGHRRGLLGTTGFLALQAHATSTSVTRRGLFVRDVLLCQSIPPPPANENTSIPQASEDTPTMRDRVAQHLEDPTCATCHEITDPIGLGLENFDGLGSWRDEENGYPIDPSGELDGVPFANGWELAQAVHDHPSLAPCLVETTYAYAGGRLVSGGEGDLLEWHNRSFAASGHRFLALLEAIATSPGFRAAGAVE